MSKVIAYEFHEYAAGCATHTYVTDDFCRIVHDTRTGEWTLFRIPTPDDLLEMAAGVKHPRITDLAAYAAPIRVTPPTLADAPYHSAEVAVDD